MKNILVINSIPTLLNKLYIPIIRNNKPTIIKNKDCKDFIMLVQMESIRQKIKVLEGPIYFYCDIDTNRKFDIDAVLKLLLDSLEGIAYKNDNQILDLRIRKHKSDFDKLTILIENL